MRGIEGEAAMRRWWLGIGLFIFSAAVFAGDGSCQLISARTCVEGPSTKMISGEPVTRDCWKYESTYNCAADTYTDQCTPLVAKGCSQTGATCIAYLSDGTTCSLYEQKYQCLDKKGGTSTVMDCGGQTYCMDGKCFDTSYASDKDFGMAVTGLEIARQMGNYLDPDNLTLFNGVSGKCSVRLGVFNCCTKNTKAGSDNGSMASQLGMNLVTSVGGEAIKYYGSYFVHDALYSVGTPAFIQSGFEGLFGESFASGTFTPTTAVSMYGVTIGYGTAASSGLAISANIGGGFYLAFNPTTFIIAIVIMVITELMKCDQDEQVLAQKRGQNLCAEVGSYCSVSMLGVCMEDKKSFCCYNSRLARLISVAGHAQLGKPWGEAKAPDCSGFTTVDIAKMDFSLMNFSEVIGEIKAAVKTPDFAVGRAKTLINSYYTPTTP
jgi:conjugal transfer mating pair stabilization protein TraN